MAKLNIFNACLNVYTAGIHLILVYLIITYHPSWIGLEHVLNTPQSLVDVTINNDIATPDHYTIINTNPSQKHPLDPMNKNELQSAIDIIKSSLQDTSQADSLYIHGYWPIFPSKNKVIDYLNLNTNNQVKFDRRVTVDISYIPTTPNNALRQYHNLIIDVDSDAKSEKNNCKAKIVSQSPVNTEHGFPMFTLQDVMVTSKAVLSDTAVIEYFTQDLGINLESITNGDITCIGTAPVVDYLYTLKDKIDLSHRFSFPICWDNSHTTEYRYQNQIPFVAIFDIDLQKVYDFFTCHDLGVPCVHFSDFKLKLYSWTDVTNKNEFKKLGISNDVISECQKQRYLNEFDEQYRRPKIEFNVVPMQRNFVIKNDHLVQWMGWTFHEQFHIRFGTYLSDIRFDNRQIAYALHLSEIYVPYQMHSLKKMSSLWWYSKFYLDGSQFGAGTMISTNGYLNTMKELDCPSHAHWFETDFLMQDGQILSDIGDGLPLIKYACLFERDTGTTRIRHAELFFPEDKPVTVPNIQLVYRYALTVGHYDYVIEKVFDMAGNIKVFVAAHGYNQVLQIQNSDFNNKYCGYLSDNYCAPRHDHFFSFRVDMDIDGHNKNSFYKGSLIEEEMDVRESWIEMNEERKRRGDNANDDEVFNSGNEDKDQKVHQTKNGKGHIWYYKEEKMENENDCKLTSNPLEPKTWVFRSDVQMNTMGVNRGYEIYTVGQDIDFKREMDDVRDSGNLWNKYAIHVSKYHENELFASGNYTWQSHGYQGLYQYTLDNENVESQDLVAWITLGFHHVTKPEDAPILAEKRRSFVIEPNNFFDFNPAACGDDI